MVMQAMTKAAEKNKGSLQNISVFVMINLNYRKVIFD